MTAPESIEAVAEAVLSEHEYMPCSEHTPTVNVWWAECEGCDWKGPRRPNRHGRDDDHRAHVAQALATALAAREQDALGALRERLTNASNGLMSMAQTEPKREAHLYSKAEGVRLAASYVDEAIRSERADAVGGEA